MAKNTIQDEHEREYYKEYKRLGGKKNKKQYFENLDIFIYETLGAFTGTDEPRYDSREESMYAVSKIAKIPMREVNLILESVDNIDAYT